jgi:hypothetical protein
MVETVCKFLCKRKNISGKPVPILKKVSSAFVNNDMPIKFLNDIFKNF